LDLNEEKYLETFSENDKFYILTVGTIINTLNLYVFSNNEVQKQKIDLRALQLYKSNTEKATIYRVFERSVGSLKTFESAFTLTKIPFGCMVSINDSAKKRKCYSNKNQIIITLDFNDAMTQLIFIDLNTYNATLQNIDKATLEGVPIDKVKSNSFLIENKLLQFIISKKMMNLSLKDLNNNLIKEYNFNYNDKFSITNARFVGQNDTRSAEEFETTEQFIRRVIGTIVGVSCYNQNGNYLVGIGGVFLGNSASSGGPGIGGVGMSMGGISSGIGYVQPINFVGMSYRSHNTRSAIPTNCLFDKNLTHIEGSMSELAFDKINTFESKLPSITDEAIYRMNGAYYYGYYYEGIASGNGRFFIYKFTD